VVILGEDPPMTDACQWNESDYNYLHRRWEANGWHYITTTNTAKTATPWYSPATAPRARPLTAAATSSGKTTAARHSEVHTLNPIGQGQGHLPAMEIFEYAGAYGFKTTAEGDGFVRLRMEEIEARAKHFEARGNDGHAPSCPSGPGKPLSHTPHRKEPPCPTSSA
jgi:type VI secretion system secreted protein VgrG